jgi:hypothetical protein
MLLDLGVRSGDDALVHRKPPMQNVLKLGLAFSREMVDDLGVDEASAGVAMKMVDQLIHDLPALRQQVGTMLVRHVKRAIAGEHRIIIPHLDFGGGKR